MYRGLSFAFFVVLGAAVHVQRQRLNLRNGGVQVGLIDKLCKKHQATFEAGGRCSEQVNEDSKNLCDITDMCGPEHVTFERCKLPQLPEKPQGNDGPSENRTLWLTALDEAGIESIDDELPLGELLEHVRPTQVRIDQCRTCKVALDALQCFTKEGTFPSHAQCRANNDAYAQKVMGSQATFAGDINPRCFCAWDADITVMENGQILDGHHRWAGTWLLMHDAATPPAFRTQARAYVERLKYKTEVPKSNAGLQVDSMEALPALGVPDLLKVAKTAHSKNPAQCQHPTNPNQAVCFQECGLAFFQK